MRARVIAKRLLTVLLLAAIMSTATASVMQAQVPTQEELDAAVAFVNEALDFVKSVVSGDLAAQGFRPTPPVVQEMFRVVPALATEGVLGAHFSPNWFASYYHFGAELTVDMMTGLRGYAVQMWLVGHTPGYERLRATLALPDMYRLPAGMAQWRLDLLAAEWVMTKMQLVGVSYNLGTGKLERRYDSVHHMAILSRLMGLAQRVESGDTYRTWLETHRASILLLVGDRGFDSLMQHGNDLDAQTCSGVAAREPHTQERDRAWLLFVVQQLVEFADTAEEYVGWLKANKSGLVGELSEAVYNELLDYARAFVELSYRGLRADEIPPDMDPVAMVLYED